MLCSHVCPSFARGMGTEDIQFVELTMWMLFRDNVGILSRETEEFCSHVLSVARKVCHLRGCKLQVMGREDST